MVDPLVCRTVTDRTNDAHPQYAQNDTRQRTSSDMAVAAVAVAPSRSHRRTPYDCVSLAKRRVGMAVMALVAVVIGHHPSTMVVVVEGLTLTMSSLRHQRSTGSRCTACRNALVPYSVGDVFRRRVGRLQRQGDSCSRGNSAHFVGSDGWDDAAAAAPTAAASSLRTTDSTLSPTESPPMAFSAGYSGAANLVQAIQEAVTMAMAGLPPPPPPLSTLANRGDSRNEFDQQQQHQQQRVVDLCVVTVSSLYDGAVEYTPAVTTVPAVLAAAQTGQVNVRHIIGCSSAGAIASRATVSAATAAVTPTPTTPMASCTTVELEGIPCVSVTLAMLPDCQLHTFHVAAADLPDDEWDGAATDRTSADEWKRAVGVSKVPMTTTTTTTGPDVGTEKRFTHTNNAPLFWLLPSPAFATNLDSLLQGLTRNFPACTLMGGIASTVSSLSRAKLYRWSHHMDTSDVAFTDGCVGVAVTGDIQCQTLTALGAKPVGGIYQILQGQDTTIQIIVLDERATDALNDDTNNNMEDDDEDDDDDDIEENIPPVDAKEALAQVYAKARIPKPVLAEANFLMRTLSDSDQAFMRRQLLVGLDQGGSVGRTASELARLAAGLGHRFTVYPVVSAGMKDGSVTLALGSVQIAPGTRLRFFVRDSDFAVQEVEALWTGYKTRVWNDQFRRSSSGAGSSGADGTAAAPLFTPAGCFLVPTLDRGSKFFQGKQQCYESSKAARMLPGVQCISGFFSNGSIGLTPATTRGVDEQQQQQQPNYGVQGSASAYFLLGSKSGRPVYSAAAEAYKTREAAWDATNQPPNDPADPLAVVTTAPLTKEAAPKYENGELILKRREVHSGRALTVSAVEWSVAEKAAKPSSALEGFMWDKETEVDRFRERVPLSDLASQCRLASVNPDVPPARDWIGSVVAAASAGRFIIVPEFKRTDPAMGPLRRRYDVGKLAQEFSAAGAPAVSVNCDAVLFGGSIEHIQTAKTAASEAGAAAPPPVLASDLILYPYQLYKLRLAGADAVNLVIGALSASKDVFYLTKIASSLSLQTIATVTSTVQIKRVTEALPAGSLHAVVVSNRILEDFSMDETGEQALALLRSDALVELRAKHGADMLVLAEGRVGLIERMDEQGNMSTAEYLRALQIAGAAGAIVGSGLAYSIKGGSEEAIRLLQEQVNA